MKCGRLEYRFIAFEKLILQENSCAPTEQCPYVKNRTARTFNKPSACLCKAILFVYGKTRAVPWLERKRRDGLKPTIILRGYLPSWQQIFFFYGLCAVNQSIAIPGMQAGRLRSSPGTALFGAFYLHSIVCCRPLHALKQNTLFLLCHAWMSVPRI